jgi:hypothetical protein
MSWQGHPYYRWRKTHRGQPYTVTCQELKVNRWTKDGSWDVADNWWTAKLRELNGPTAEERAEAAELANMQRIVGTMSEWGINFVENGSPVAVADIPQTMAKVVEKAKQPKVANTIGEAIDQFLNVKLADKPTATTFKEWRNILGIVRGWWGSLPCSTINEELVLWAFGEVSKMDITDMSKKKRWLKIRALVEFLAENRKCETPRNLHSKRLRFKVEHAAPQRFPLATVRQQLADLPPRYKLYALLAANCSMNNCDIGHLTKDMVVDGVLTKKRVKTASKKRVPVVSYRLWPETIALLDQFKSDHPTLWILSERGQPLVNNRMVSGKPVVSDNIGSRWTANVGDKCVPLCKFRSIVATLLGSQERFRSLRQLYLGHAPTSIVDKHYDAGTGDTLDAALEWVRTCILKPEK